MRIEYFLSFHKNAAFTLIECLIYLGLVSIMIQGILLAFYSFSHTLAHSEAIAHLENESAFIIAEVAYEDSHALSTSYSSSTDESTFVRFDGTTHVLSFKSNDIELTDSSGTTMSLIDPNDTFHLEKYAQGSSSVLTERSSAIEFTLQTHSSSGEIVSQSFSTVSPDAL